jgi:hypothetical protein
MTADNFCFYLLNRLLQTSPTGGQWYNDTSPFIIPCPDIQKQPPCVASFCHFPLPGPRLESSTLGFWGECSTTVLDTLAVSPPSRKSMFTLADYGSMKKQSACTKKHYRFVIYRKWTCFVVS